MKLTTPGEYQRDASEKCPGWPESGQAKAKRELERTREEVPVQKETSVRLATVASGSNGSLAVSQLRLVLLARYAAFRGRTSTYPPWFALYFRFARKPHTSKVPTVIANVANGIRKPIFIRLSSPA